MGGGRPAKPKHLKVLHGDQKCRVNSREPEPSGEVVPPYALDGDVQAVWDRLAPDRVRKGVLTAWDVDAFALFCEALVICRGKVHDAKTLMPRPGCASPMSEFKAAVGVLATLGGRFGWTPSDRAKLVMPEAEPDERERLLS